MPLLLALALACNYGTRCETVVSEVGDDDALGDFTFTVSDLVASVEGVRSFPATSRERAPMTATLDLARGDGTAVLTDSTWVTDRSTLESAMSSDQMFIVCADTLDVPLAIGLTTADGEFDIEGSAHASIGKLEGEDSGGVGTVEIEHGISPAVSTVPDDAGGELRLNVQITDGPARAGLRHVTRRLAPLLPAGPAVMRLVLLLALSACNYGTRCETVEVEVGDDDALGDISGTLGELYASVEGVRSFPATSDSGAAMTATLDLARGEGAAVFSDATWVADRTRLESAFQNDLMFRSCDDRVVFPLALSLTTEDGAFDVDGAADATSTPWTGANPVDVGAVDIVHTIIPDVSTTPEAASGPLRVRAHISGAHLEQVTVTTDADHILHYPPVSP